MTITTLESQFNDFTPTGSQILGTVEYVCEFCGRAHHSRHFIPNKSGKIQIESETVGCFVLKENINRFLQNISYTRKLLKNK